MLLQHFLCKTEMEIENVLYKMYWKQPFTTEIYFILVFLWNISGRLLLLKGDIYCYYNKAVRMTFKSPSALKMIVDFLHLTNLDPGVKTWLIHYAHHKHIKS